jgi:hypothetical protein
MGSVRGRYKQEDLVVVAILNKLHGYMGSVAVKE